MNYPPPISAFDIFSVCDFVVDEFVCKFALRRTYTALTVINAKIDFAFLARLFVNLR